MYRFLLLLHCMTQIKFIERKTEVVSISLPPVVVKRMEKQRARFSQSRSAFIASLITRYSEDERWNTLYKMGAKTAQKFSLRTEDDVDRILHES